MYNKNNNNNNNLKLGYKSHLTALKKNDRIT